jgi:hypothetical protein
MTEEIKKSRYKVKGTDIKHDDVRYPEGSEILLSDAEAAELKRWLEPLDSAEPAKKKGADK